MERTLVLLKPDAVHRSLVGKIIARFEEKGLQLVGLQMRRFGRDLLERHYAEHAGKPFYESLVRYMSSAPAVALCLEGRNAIEVTRGMMGKTDGARSAPGTIRGDFGNSFSNNLVHGSDGPEAAAREIPLFFGGEGELLDWEPCQRPWVYNLEEEG